MFSRIHSSMSLKRLAVCLALVMAAKAGSSDLESARKLYNLTEFDQSLKILHAILPKDGPVYELMGMNWYMQTDYKKATESLEKAAELQPANAEYALWLGRAFGRR